MTGVASAIAVGETINKAVELTKKVAELVKKGATLELQERITDLREAVLNAKDEVLALREENQSLQSQVAEAQSWRSNTAAYQLIETPGGAHLYHTEGPPSHYACPKCFAEHLIHILQVRTTKDFATCPNCKITFTLTPPKEPQVQRQRGGSWMSR